MTYDLSFIEIKYLLNFLLSIDILFLDKKKS